MVWNPKRTKRTTEVPKGHRTTEAPKGHPLIKNDR